MPAPPRGPASGHHEMCARSHPWSLHAARSPAMSLRAPRRLARGAWGNVRSIPTEPADILRGVARWASGWRLALFCVAVTRDAKRRERRRWPAIEAAVERDPPLRALLAPRADAFQSERGEGGDRVVSEGWRAANEKHYTDLGVRLPRYGNGEMEIGVSRFASLRVRMRLENASPSEVAVDRGRAVYRSVFPDVDRIVASTATTVEDLFLLRSDKAHRDLVYRVELAEGLTRIEAQEGALAFVDDRNRIVMRLPQPYALDARGTRRDLSMRWEEKRTASDFNSMRAASRFRS